MSDNYYKNLSAEDLAQLCVFKDGTIEILQRALNTLRESTQRDEYDKENYPEPHYCEVTFPNNIDKARRYTYKTGGLAVKVGDRVTVPVEYDNGHKDITNAVVVSLLSRESVTHNAYFKTILSKESS